jgi:hypothetical protein
MYKPFNDFVIRTPLLPYNVLYSALHDTTSFNKLLLDNHFQEAVYIASPVLYDELQKYLRNELKNEKEKSNVLSSLTKYMIRMSTRCTPFGIFAGCSVGNFKNEDTSITFDGSKRKCSRLDMIFLCNLSKKLSSVPEIRDQLRFFPNNSIYKIGRKYRYVEYVFKPTGRLHHISSVKIDSYIKSIINESINGKTKSELSALLVSDVITFEEAYSYIDDIINSQLLVSELEVSVTGEDYFTRILSIVSALNIKNKIYSNLLVEIQELLSEIRSSDHCCINFYKKIVEKIDEFELPYEKEYILQVDLFKKLQDNRLNIKIIDELKSSFEFLNKINPLYSNGKIQKFKELFTERYEEREIPLLEALDPESGIGYPPQTASTGMNNFFNGLIFPKKIDPNKTVNLNRFETILFKKITEASVNNEKEILINDDDLIGLSANWDDLNNTLSTKFQIIENDENKLLLIMDGFFGPNAAKLLARFCHTDEKIENLCKDICTKEQVLSPDVIIAEIAHLPDSRIGNIISRPHLRPHEIEYLSYNFDNDVMKIPTSDLMLSVRQNRLILRSKKFNKLVLPVLSSAHNYMNNSMPVYHFFGDMQNQSGRFGLVFSWGSIKNEFNFRPRVKYKNTIFSLASWTIYNRDIKAIIDIKKDDEKFKMVNEWRIQKGIPDLVSLVDNDNKLLIDWSSEVSVRAFLSSVKNSILFELEEFLFDDATSIVHENNDGYINEFIIPYYRDIKNEK